jgi:hypothetical protein
MTWACLACWAVATLEVHILIHEGAHWVALKAFGAQGLRLRPYPVHYAGRWYWGLTNWQSWPSWTPARGVVAFFAPVLAELAWAVLALSAALLWRWSALEAGAALVDVAVGVGWVLRRPGSDARAVLDALE